MLTEIPTESTDSVTIPPVQLAAVAALHAEPDRHVSEPLTCPFCGSGNLHILASGVHQGRTITLIGADGLHIIDGLPPHEYGSAVVSLFEAECGHFAAEITRFQRGDIYRSVHLIPDGLVPIDAVAELVRR